MLITSLQDALRAEGVRTATVVSRGPGLTAVSISHGARTTLERDIPLGYVAQVVAWIDPTVGVVFAEGYEEHGAPAVELRPRDAEPLGVLEQELLAVVDPEEIATAFAQEGPGYTAGVAERILREILGREPSDSRSDAPPMGETPPADEAREAPEAHGAGEREAGRLGRLFRRLRG